MFYLPLSDFSLWVVSFSSCLICSPWLCPVFWPCPIYFWLCSGHSQVPLAVLSLLSTIRTFPSLIPWSSLVLGLYIWYRDAQFIHLVPKEACSLWRVMMTICSGTTELLSLSLLYPINKHLPLSPSILHSLPSSEEADFVLACDSLI